MEEENNDDSQKLNIDYVTVCFELKPTSTFFSTFSSFFFFFFFFFSSPQLLTLSNVNSAYVYCLRSHKLHFLTTFLLKMGPTTLFTHLKIISLQCFQFQFSVSAKISSIQTHPIFQNLALNLVLNKRHMTFIIVRTLNLANLLTKRTLLVIG